MTITVKFFAALREQCGIDTTEIALPTDATVTGVWRAVQKDHALAERTERILSAVNYEYADGDVMVRDGDEVAFFPPVTGG